jgi:hypothetical protein
MNIKVDKVQIRLSIRTSRRRSTWLDCDLEFISILRNEARRRLMHIEAKGMARLSPTWILVASEWGVNLAQHGKNPNLQISHQTGA